MATFDDAPSTTWGWVKVKIEPHASATPDSAGGSSQSLARQSRARLRNKVLRSPIDAVLRLRGGPECWVQVTARGSTWHFHGATSIYDVLQAINEPRQMGGGR
jgi:hypothetical protein